MPPAYAPFFHYIDNPDHGRVFRVTDAGGLDVDVDPGRARINQTVYELAGVTLTLADNNTNSVYISSAGAIASGVAGFPANSIPLAVVVTLAGDITSVTDNRCFFYEDTAAGGGGYDTIEDEGVPLAQRTTIDFVGAGVTAADVAGETRVTIPGGAGAHDLLSATHTDTLPAAVVDGDLAIGNVTPVWSRLAIVIPAANVRNVLGVDNGELRPSWKAALDAVNPANIAAAAAPGTSLIFSHRDHVHAHPAALGVDLHHTELHAAAEHNAAVLTAGANENLGAFYLDIDDIAVPADPGAGVRRLFVDTATGEISVRTAAAATVSLEGAGGGLALANKGELHGYAAADAIVAAAGADNQVLQSDAADAEGLTWRAIPRLAGIADTGGVTRIALSGAAPEVIMNTDVRVNGRLSIDSAAAASSEFTISPSLTIVGATWIGVQISPILTTVANNSQGTGVLGVATFFAHAGSTGHTVKGLDFQANFFALNVVAAGATVSGCEARPGILAQNAAAAATVTDVNGFVTDYGNIRPIGIPGATIVIGTLRGLFVDAAARNLSAGVSGTTFIGVHVTDFTPVGAWTNIYLLELGPSTPYFRVVGGAAPGALLTNCWADVGTVGLRQFQVGAANSAVAGFRHVMVAN